MKTNLTDALRALYDELHEAITTIPVRDGFNLRYDSVEVELAMEMGESTEGGGGAKFWVVEANAKKAVERRSTHTMRISLTPLFEPTGPLWAAARRCTAEGPSGDAVCRSIAVPGSEYCRPHQIHERSRDEYGDVSLGEDGQRSTSS